MHKEYYEAREDFESMGSTVEEEMALATNTSQPKFFGEQLRLCLLLKFEHPSFLYSFPQFLSKFIKFRLILLTFTV